MPDKKRSFLHESLQDRQTIQQLLQQITEGIASGELLLSDGDDELILQPDGLLHLKLSANQEEGRNRVNLRLTWHDEIEREKPTELRVNGKKLIKGK